MSHTHTPRQKFLCCAESWLPNLPCGLRCAPGSQGLGQVEARPSPFPPDNCQGQFKTFACQVFLPPHAGCLTTPLTWQCSGHRCRDGGGQLAAWGGWANAQLAGGPTRSHQPTLSQEPNFLEGAGEQGGRGGSHCPALGGPSGQSGCVLRGSQTERHTGSGGEQEAEAGWLSARILPSPGARLSGRAASSAGCGRPCRGGGGPGGSSRPPWGPGTAGPGRPAVPERAGAQPVSEEGGRLLVPDPGVAVEVEVRC